MDSMKLLNWITRKSGETEEVWVWTTKQKTDDWQNMNNDSCGDPSFWSDTTKGLYGAWQQLWDVMLFEDFTLGDKLEFRVRVNDELPMYEKWDEMDLMPTSPTGDSHTVSSKENWMDLLNQFLSFFRRYSKQNLPLHTFMTNVFIYKVPKGSESVMIGRVDKGYIVDKYFKD